MSNIINFPLLADREWKVWEDAIRSSSYGTSFDDAVVLAALPWIKEHWEELFKSATIETPPRSIPGPLTNEQGRAIQEMLDSSAEALVAYVKNQRAIALGRLVQCELTLAYYRTHGVPP